MIYIETRRLMCFRLAMGSVYASRWLVIGLVLAQPAFAASCDTAKAPPVPVIKGLPYQQAREAVLAAGWKPLAGHPHNDLSSNETTFRDRGWSELQFCRMTADSACRFAFTVPAGFTLWVTSTGEENTLLQNQATVKGATLACAGDPDPG
jgi:hypothetical protein